MSTQSNQLIPPSKSSDLQKPSHENYQIPNHGENTVQKVVKTEKPSSGRLQSLTLEETNKIPWLKPLINAQICDLKIPILPVQPIPHLPQYKYEDQFNVPEEVPNGEDSISSIRATKDQLSKFKKSQPFPNNDDFIPLVISESVTLAQKMTAPPFTLPPEKIKWVTFIQAENKSQGTHSSFYIEFFAFNDFPLTEPFRAEFRDNQVHYHSAGRVLIHPMIPFPIRAKNCKIVALAYMLMPHVDGTNGYDLFAVGSQDIPLSGNFDLSPGFVPFNPSLSLKEHISLSEGETITKLSTITVTFKCQIFDSLEILSETFLNKNQNEASISDSNPNELKNDACPINQINQRLDNIRMTAYNRFYPSPLLTVSDISLDLKEGSIPKKSKIYIELSVKSDYVPKNSEEKEKKPISKLPIGLSTDSDGFVDTVTGPAVLVSKNIHIPQMYNFQMDPDIQIHNGVIITANVFILDSTGQHQQLLTGTMEVTQPYQVFQVKMEGKGTFINNMKATFSKGDNVLKAIVTYPTIIAPPDHTRSTLEGNITPPDPQNMSFQQVSTYCIEQECNKAQTIDFKFLYSLFMASPSELTQAWIEHYWAPPDNFIRNYLQGLVVSFDTIKDNPYPFFCLLFKALVCSNEELFDVLTSLFDRISYETSKNEKAMANVIRISADFLILLHYTLNKDQFIKISYKFISKLSLASRYIVYQVIFASISFINGLVLQTNMSFKKPRSPFVPLLSLFYISIETTFRENKTEDIVGPCNALRILSVSLERYPDHNANELCAQTLFPLITILFTYHESLKTRVDEVLLRPMILFFLKYCRKDQFMQYYSILSPDNRLRFFDFLTSMASEGNCQSLAKRGEIRVEKKNSDMTTSSTKDILSEEQKKQDREYETQKTLAYVNEITWRILRFVRFFEGEEIKDERMVKSILSLLQTLLLRCQQSEQSFSLCIQTFTTFLIKFQKQIFIDHHPFIVDIITTLVELSQRNMFAYRKWTIALLLFLLDQEKESGSGNGRRIEISLQYSIAKYYLNHEKFRPFFEYLPQTMKPAQILYDKLFFALNPTSYLTDYKSESKSESIKKSSSTELLKSSAEAKKQKRVKIPEQEISILLKIHDEYDYFPSIRALIYSRVSELNQNNDFSQSAFVAQWSLCALIAEVFKLRNESVPGIPSNGFDGFPYCQDLIPIRNIYQRDFSFLVLQSDLFTPNSMNKALRSSMMYCETSGLRWLLGSTTDIYFDFLEKRREYEVLQEFYKQVAESFTKLFESPKIPIGFLHISGGKKVEHEVGYNEIIRTYTIEAEDEFTKRLLILIPDLEIITSAHPIPINQLKENQIQILVVRYNHEQLENLQANTFEYDDMLVEQREKKNSKRGSRNLSGVRHSKTTTPEEISKLLMGESNEKGNVLEKRHMDKEEKKLGRERRRSEKKTKKDLKKEPKIEEDKIKKNENLEPEKLAETEIISDQEMKKNEDQIEPKETEIKQEDLDKLGEKKIVEEEIKQLVEAEKAKDLERKNKLKEIESIQWNQKFVMRYTWTTKSKLPGCNPNVEVDAPKTVLKEMTRQDYFIDRMKAFSKELKMVKDDLESVIPPEELARNSAQGLAVDFDLTPLFNLIGRVVDSDEESEPVMHFVKTEKELEEAFERNPEMIKVPEEIRELCNQIWSECKQAMHVIATIFKFKKFLGQEALTNHYNKELGIVELILPEPTLDGELYSRLRP